MTDGRQWCARRDGEILFMVSGPDAESMCRAAGETVAYRDDVKPARENGYALQGPWIEAGPPVLEPGTMYGVFERGNPDGSTTADFTPVPVPRSSLAK